ncbi:hypothetical protein TCDM_10181 [Trypanosoma cruzi Dm28c]|uniref:Uncharacterized protein n=1 Tax=Trypanosoma cruzi Dm28c TaxID=1416333 RepID=V5BCR4_TRYCR|nr:hypothetical protein TCDM_10181 [Trypanosoma cruzi Dm28c]
MNRCRQDALTINMAREHAATPHRSTEEKGEKQEAAQTSGRNKRQAGKAPQRASPWPATPHQPSHTHHRSAASPRVRRLGFPHNSHTATASSSIPQPTGYSHSPLPAHNAHGASNHPKSHTRKRFLIHPAMTRRLTPRGASRQQKKRLAVHTLSPPFPSRPRKEAAAARICQHRIQRKFPTALQCVCPARVAVCAHCHAHQSRKRK